MTTQNNVDLTELVACQEVFAGLTVKDADKAIEFYTEVLGAEEVFRVTDPDGRVPYSCLRIGDAIFGINSEYPEVGKLSAETLGGCSTAVTLCLADANMAYKAAMAAGATKISAPTETFWGILTATVKDPFGNLISLSQKLEALSPEQIVARAEKVNAVSKHEAA